MVKFDLLPSRPIWPYAAIQKNSDKKLNNPRLDHLVVVKLDLLTSIRLAIPDGGSEMGVVFMFTSSQAIFPFFRLPTSATPTPGQGKVSRRTDVRLTYIQYC